jgi:hypothetical protein
LVGQLHGMEKTRTETKMNRHHNCVAACPDGLKHSV